MILSAIKKANVIRPHIFVSIISCMEHCTKNVENWANNTMALMKHKRRLTSKTLQCKNKHLKYLKFVGNLIIYKIDVTYFCRFTFHKIFDLQVFKMVADDAFNLFQWKIPYPEGCIMNLLFCSGSWTSSCN